MISAVGAFVHPASQLIAQSSKKDIYVSGSLEIGRALTSTSNDTTGVVLTAGRKPATTLSGGLSLDFGRLTLFGAGGFSLSQSNEGGYGRIATNAELLRSKRGNPLLQLGGDLTSVYSPSLPTLSAAGITVTAGDPSVVSGSLRAGGRWRAGLFTSVTSLEIGRLLVRNVSSSSMLSAYLYSSAAVTSAPQQRNVTLFGSNSGGTNAALGPMDQAGVGGASGVGALLPSGSVPLNSNSGAWLTSKRSAAVGDIGGNLQFAHGSWILGVRGVARVGSSVTLWDDPVPDKGYLRQDRDAKTGLVVRGMWFALPNLAITAEAGRQLSDPIMGFSGLRYASLSAKMSFEAGKSRIGLARKRQFEHAAAVLRSIKNSSQLVSQKLNDHDGWYQFSLQVADAKLVEVAGDFSEWEPIKLSLCKTAAASSESESAVPDSDGSVKSWCGKFKLAAGVYKIVYRVNGGEWEVPEGLTSVSDGFDGEVGLLIAK